jgi:ABC-2 family transporter protein
MHLPLAELELRRTGARKLTYAARVIVIAGMWPALLSLWLFTHSGGVTSSDDIMRMGSQLIMSGIRSFQFLAVFVMGPLFTAGLIAEERREGTLGMLLLADFRGRDILFAKFLSAFLTVELLVLSSLPVLAIASSLGGIDVPAMALQIFLLSCAAAAVCAIGLMCSARANSPVEALFMTALMVAVWYGGTYLMDVANVVAQLPMFFNLGLAAQMPQRGSLAPGYWVPGVVLAGIITVLALFETLRRLHKQTEPRPAKRTKRALRGSKRRSILDRMLPKSPEAQLIVSGASGLPVHAWSSRARTVLALALMPLAFVQCAGWLLVTALICYDVTSSVGTARQNGAFDAVLITPLSDRRLARSMVNAFLRRSVLYFPALVAPGLMTVYQMLWQFRTLGGGPGLLVGVLFISLALAPAAGLVSSVALSCAATALHVSAPFQAAAAIIANVAITFTVSIGINTSMVLFGPPMQSLAPYFIVSPVVGALAQLLASFIAYRLFERHLARSWRAGAAKTARSRWGYAVRHL